MAARDTLKLLEEANSVLASSIDAKFEAEQEVASAKSILKANENDLTLKIAMGEIPNLKNAEQRAAYIAEKCAEAQEVFNEAVKNSARASNNIQKIESTISILKLRLHLEQQEEERSFKYDFLAKEIAFERELAKNE